MSNYWHREAKEAPVAYYTGALAGLRAITLYQPWAWCVFHARPRKDIENRFWAAPATLIGEPLAIHAGRNEFEFDEAAAWIEAELGIVVPPRRLRVESGGVESRNGGGAPNPAMPFGAIVGVVTYAGLAPREWESKWKQRGACHWELRDARPLQTPVVYRGRRGLFRVESGGVESQTKQHWMEAVL